MNGLDELVWHVVCMFACVQYVYLWFVNLYLLRIFFFLDVFLELGLIYSTTNPKANFPTGTVKYNIIMFTLVETESSFLNLETNDLDRTSSISCC